MASRPAKPRRFASVERSGARADPSRREFLGATAAAGLVAASCTRDQPQGQPAPATTAATTVQTARPSDLLGDGRKRRILLGAAWCSASTPPWVISRKPTSWWTGRIARVAPSIEDGEAEVIDCSGTIVMPGFITTHHHASRLLARRAHWLGSRAADAPARGGARPCGADQRPGQGWTAAAGQPQPQQPVSSELPRELLREGREHHGTGLRLEAVMTTGGRDRRMGILD